MDTMDIIRQLEADEALRAQLRAVLLGDELLELPRRMSQLAETVDKLVQAHAQAERRLEGVERRLEGVEDDLGDLKGTAFEARVRHAPRRYVPRALATSIRPLSDDYLETLLGALDAEVAADVARADLFLSATTADGEAALLVVEVAWRAHIDDVERAERRAAGLRGAAPEARPLVISNAPPDRRVVSAAHARGVAVVSEPGGLLTLGQPAA